MKLCCMVNPVGQCSHCKGKLCWDHIVDSNMRPDCPYCNYKCTIYSYPLRIRSGWYPDRLEEINWF